MGLVGDARRQDHVLGEEVFNLLEKLPGVQADAHHYRFIGLLLVVGGEGLLAIMGAYYVGVGDLSSAWTGLVEAALEESAPS